VGIFQYHDEPLAASSRLPDKVDEDIAKDRIKKLNSILEGIYEKKRDARKGVKQVGYIMEIHEKTAIVRPELHAPEVDEYDEIALTKIDGIIEIGSKVQYFL